MFEFTSGYIRSLGLLALLELQSSLFAGSLLITLLQVSMEDFGSTAAFFLISGRRGVRDNGFGSWDPEVGFVVEAGNQFLQARK